MKIANIELGERALLLAPMEDVTDPSFRYMCKRFGADMVYTEFISSDGLIRDAAKSLKKLEIDDAERPVGIQIYGHLIDPMVEAARMAEAAGPDVIDINFGCPVKKIAGRGAGSGMMRDVPLMVEMTRRIVAAVKKPVTVKTRLGWDEESKNIEEIALRLQDVGIAALTIHGRTRAQMYRGEADWTLIGKVKNNPQIRIPIIGNGDVDSGPKAREMFDRYGVDGVMIGRATYGRPWIFREVKHYLSTGEALPQPSVAERVAIAKEHLQKSLEIKGDHVGILEMRRHMTNYFKGLPDFKSTRLKLVTSLDTAELFATLDEIGDEPDPADYGVWVPGIPVLIGNALEAAGAAEWLNGLILDGIVAGVGAVLGFVPQMLVLFFLLSILEDVGYMARVAFIMDRIFRKFGLSGKSFIPMLVGTGCGVPGVMASRTIENERDRRMTIMTTCFIPCGAKMPIIGLIAGAMFGGSPLVAVSAYFIGMAAIICSGIILKKTKIFAGDPAPFVMELPAYHVPAWGNVFRATWERGWSFIKRAGSVILLATVVLWFLQGFGFENGVFGMVEDQDNSVLAAIATKIAWIFAPLGFGNWRATVASVSGLIAKENVVGTFGVLYHFGGELSENGDEIWAAVAQDYTALSAYAFMIFNLLCAPCFAAMGAIKREMNNGKWTAIAIGYMCALAYCAALVVYQLGGLITGEIGFNFFTIVAAVVLVAFIYLMVRPNKYAGNNEVKIDVTKI